MEKYRDIRSRLANIYDTLEPRGAWLALLAVTLNNVLMSIGDSSFGIMYDDLIDKYHSTRAVIGWAESLFWAFIYISSKSQHSYMNSCTCMMHKRTGSFYHEMNSEIKELTAPPRKYLLSTTFDRLISTFRIFVYLNFHFQHIHLLTNLKFTDIAHVLELVIDAGLYDPVYLVYLSTCFFYLNTRSSQHPIQIVNY